jgi:LPXTG-motif cell wall-anchored protein
LFASPNATQLRPLRAVFEVSLRQDPTDRSHHGQGGLPSTGGPRLWVLFAGSAALGLGLALVRRRRTEEQEAVDVAF